MCGGRLTCNGVETMPLLMRQMLCVEGKAAIASLYVSYEFIHIYKLLLIVEIFSIERNGLTIATLTQMKQIVVETIIVQ